jgi:hypothetical protein
MYVKEPSLRSYELVDLLTGECHGQGTCRVWKSLSRKGSIPKSEAFNHFLIENQIPEWDNYSRPLDQLVPIASSCPPPSSNLKWPCLQT